MFVQPCQETRHVTKIFKHWSGPFQITAKISDLNYEILGHKDPKLVVHVNRLKAAHGYDGRESKPRTRRKRRTRKNSVSSSGSDELTGILLGTRPLVKEFSPEQNMAPSSPLCPSDLSPPTQQALDTPMSPQNDPSYLPSDTPRSRREMQSTRDGPPIDAGQGKVKRPGTGKCASQHFTLHKLSCLREFWKISLLLMIMIMIIWPCHSTNATLP